LRSIPRKQKNSKGFYILEKKIVLGLFMEMEEYGRVLDFLPEGRPNDRQREPFAQIIGEKYFTLLEISIKKGANCIIGQRLYIGKDKRDIVDKIKSRISFNDLTATARNELLPVIRNIVQDREKEFVAMFNKAGPISVRLHQLELLPGIGKKHLQEILEKRAEKPFESFKDMQTRVSLLPDPVNLISLRIKEELEGETKNYLFARPPLQKQQ
jgi:putative nucleotide binding protein